MMKTILALIAVVVLAGCASSRAPGPTGSSAGPWSPPPPGASAASAPASTGTDPAASSPRERPPALALAAEQKWLQSWFEGTPVLIALPRDVALTVDVPREFSFDAGKSAIKPPLAALLDKVAESLRRTRQASLLLVSAPSDAAGAPALALQRAEQVRKHLVMRGVPQARMAGASASSTASVQLRMEVPTLD
jgi:outer membrane protein OmpA-like peptidoglycan-associated protein